NRSFGLTTLRDRHVTVRGHALELQFRGKGGKEHRLRVVDPRLTRIVKACQDLPGYEVFQYLDEEGKRQTVDSADVNAYLREISGAEVSAKVFRTWAGTVRAMAAMRALKPEAAAHKNKKKTPAARQLVEVVKTVSRQLGNTPAICRKCYIHPALMQSFQRGELHDRLSELADHPSAIRRPHADECLRLAFLSEAAERARAVA